jgi:hypothetical protein
MFILERDDDDACLTGNAGCTPLYAIIGPNPSEMDDPTSQPSKYDKAGAHRFIGIGMVVGMAFLVLVAYLVFGRWPRRMRRKYCRRLGEESEEEISVEGGERSTKEVAVILESASASSSEEMMHRHSRRMSDYETPNIDRRSKSRKQSSSRRCRRSIYEQSAVEGAVQEGKGVDVEPGALVTGWQVEHVRAVRYEVSSFSLILLSVSVYIGPPTGSYTTRIEAASPHPEAMLSACQR